MDYFTVRNTAIAGLIQVGLIVAGVLMAGAAVKWYATFGVTPPPTTAFVSEYGFAALAVPVAWVAAAMAILRRDRTDGPEVVAAFYAGLGLTLVLLFFAVYHGLRPLLRLLDGCPTLSG